MNDSPHARILNNGSLRRLGLIIHGALALVAIFFAFGMHTAEGVLGLHATHAPAFALCVAIMSFAAFALLPAARLSASTLWHGLALEAALLVTIFTSSLETYALPMQALCALAIFWLGADELARRQAPRRQRRAYAMLTAIPAALLLLASVLPEPWREMCVIAAALVRLGLPPFHGAFVVVASEVPVCIGLPFLAAQLGCLSLLEHRFSVGEATPWIWSGVVLSALAACIALVRSDAKRVLAFAWLSQSGFVLVGVIGSLESARLGAQMLAASASLALGGLLLVVDAIESRIGRRVGADLAGLAQNGRWFSRFALALAAAAICLPGSPGFFAEDLLLDAYVERRPWVAAIAMGATVLVAVAVLRLVLLAFFGQSRGERMPRDAFPRERAALIALCVALALFAIRPALIFS